VQCGLAAEQKTGITRKSILDNLFMRIYYHFVVAVGRAKTAECAAWNLRLLQRKSSAKLILWVEGNNKNDQPLARNSVCKKLLSAQ
jgi:hypothetical protein